MAAEEAQATGAQFGPSYLDIGMELESQQHEKWKAWARNEAQLLDQRFSSLVGAPEIASAKETDESSLDNLDSVDGLDGESASAEQ